MWGVGGVEMYCGPYSAGVLHSVSDQIQNLQNCYGTPTQTKMTSKVDIQGFVSLKFLRLWSLLTYISPRKLILQFSKFTHSNVLWNYNRIKLLCECATHSDLRTLL